MTATVRRDEATGPRPELWRVTDRASFQALRSCRRTRRGAVWCTFLPSEVGAEPAPPRAAFAIGRRSGGAVVRNRIRRRLRAALREVQAQHPLAPGTYLLGGGPELATLPWPELLRDVAAVVTDAGARP